MQRNLNNIALLFVSVSAMIGSGWLFGPLYAAQIAGHYAVFSWLLGGILVIIVALTFSEVSAMLPVTGGIARFPQFSHGPLVSYTMTWIAWIAYVLLPPIEVQALIQYSANFFPHLIYHVGGKPALSLYGFITAFTMLLLMSILNIVGIKVVTKFNNILVWCKLAVPSLTAATLIICCFHPDNFTMHFTHPVASLKSVLSSLPMAGVIFSFFGFRLAIELAGEAKNPQRALPMALIGSIVLCMILYTVVQIAFIGALPSSQIAAGWAQLHFPGDAGPFVGIASLLGLHWLILFLYADAVISPFGSALMVVTTTSRLDYAMSVNGYAPKWLQKLNEKHVPHYAIALNFIVGCVLLMPFPGWQILASFILSALVISHAITPISLLAMRHQVPDQHRPFRVPYATGISVIAFIILNLISYWTGWDTMWKMAVAGIVGLIILPIFRLFQKDKPELFAKNALWLIPYFIGMLLFSYSGNFGGGRELIPFGWDMLAIAIFSIVIFFIGLASRLEADATKAQIQHESELLPFCNDEPLI